MREYAYANAAWSTNDAAVRVRRPGSANSVRVRGPDSAWIVVWMGHAHSKVLVIFLFFQNPYRQCFVPDMGRSERENKCTQTQPGSRTMPPYARVALGSVSNARVCGECVNRVLHGAHTKVILIIYNIYNSLRTASV